MPINNNAVSQYVCQTSLFQAPVSRDHSNSNCYWLFIFMLKIVQKNLGIANKCSEN